MNTTMPICPNCKAKFSHNSKLLECNVCGIPDEIASGGGALISRWKRKTAGTSKRKAKKNRHPSRNHRVKHGRRGVRA